MLPELEPEPEFELPEPEGPGVDGIGVVVWVPGVEVPDTPVAGGVVTEPVPGAHGTAVPLVPVGAGTLLVADPVLRAVVPGEVAILPGVAADPDAVAALPLAPGVVAPVDARAPASVAVFTLSFEAVVVPVELLARDDGADAFGIVLLPFAPTLDGACVVDGGAPLPTLVPVEAAPVTGTQGVVGETVGVVVPLGVVCVDPCTAVPG